MTCKVRSSPVHKITIAAFVTNSIMVFFYVICLDEEVAGRVLVAARALRVFGKVEIDATGRTLKKQLKNAEKRGARVAVIIGSDLPDCVKWKDMASREQYEIEDGRLLEFAEGAFDNSETGDA